MPKIDIRPQDWEEVNQILKVHIPEYEVWAFGSRVKWTAKQYSDLDLAVISKQPLPISLSADLNNAFDESNLSIKVDIVDWAAISESFRHIVERDKVTVQTPLTGLANWEFKKLIDCTRDGNLSYGIVQPGQHDMAGIPIIRVNNIKGGQIQRDEVLRVSPDIEAKYKRTRLEGGEVLLTLVGSSGQSAVVPEELNGWNIARAIAVIRPRPEIGANWINICLQSKDVQQFLDDRANTTVQKTLNLGDVKEVPIPIPPKAVKDGIESVAMSLENKIELNRRMNETLEAIARALFKSWFVDFDPVRAKAAGEVPDSICRRLGLTPELLALFPDRFHDSELGEIPAGWEIRQIKTLLKRLSAGRQYRKDQASCYGHVPILEQGAGILLGYHDNTPCFQASPVNPLFIFGDHTCITHLSCEPFDISQNVIPISGNDRNTLWVFYAVRDQQSFQEYRRHWKELIAKKVIIAPHSLCDEFQKVVTPFHELLESNYRQKRELSQMRDTLLPKLISGERSIPTAETAAAAGA